MQYDWGHHNKLVNHALINVIQKHKYPMWFDDVKQAASLEVYQMREEPDGTRVTAGKRRAIDELRRVLGRTNGKDSIRARALHNQVPAEIYDYGTDKTRELPLLSYEDKHLELVETIVSEIIPLDWDERWKTIAFGLYHGEKKEVIAENIGVSPGRVSQMLTLMRRDLVNRQIYWADNMEAYGSTGRR